MPKAQPNQGSGAVIAIDEGDRFKLAQAIYNAVTGKTEKLARAYGKDYLIGIQDIRQLHSKCSQACSQWDVLQKNCNITIHHLDDNKEVFSSFERFELYDASKASPTESVVFEYNLLLRLPDTDKPQPYKVTVRVLSKIAMINRMEREMGPPPFLRLFSSGHVVVEIEYVDYVVARNLLSMVDSWIAQVEQEPRYAWASKLQKISHWFPPLAYISVVFLFGVGLYRTTPSALPPASEAAPLAQWLIVAGTSIFVAGSIAKVLGRFAESGIDRVVPISAICFNKGDDRMLERFKTRNVLRIVQSGVGVALVFAQSIAANFLTDVIRAIFTR